MFNLFKMFRKKPNYAYDLRDWAFAQAHAHYPDRYTDHVATDDNGRRERFEPIAACVAVLAHVVYQKLGPKAEQVLIEVMLDSFDEAMREGGVGDMGVGPRIRKFAAAYNGRSQAYAKAIAQQNQQQLEEAIVRNGLASEKQAGQDALWLMTMAKSLSALSPQELKNLKA